MKTKGHDLKLSGRTDKIFNLHKCEDCGCILATRDHYNVYYHHSSSPYFKNVILGHIPSCDECKMDTALE